MATPSLRNAADRKAAVLTRCQIESFIADGDTIIILNQRVLKVNAWLKYHPGGDKAILHMVGRDATDEVNAYVSGPSLMTTMLITHST